MPLILLFALLASPVLCADHPAPKSLDLVKAGRAQIGVTTIYDPSYVGLSYPGGDVPKERGVCTDVVIRALRKTGTDLQKLVHEDMKAHFSASFISQANYC